MKILITGGHLTPALAVIKKLPQDAQVVYVGRQYALEGDNALSLEYKTMTTGNIPFIAFTPGRLQRKLTKHTFTSLSRVPVSVFRAIAILRQEKPDVVLTFGGHVALPFGIAAKIVGIPLMLHEQTLEAGLTNKILARFATKIGISWESSANFFPKDKTMLTGNPILPASPSDDMQQLLAKVSNKFPLIVITGGSLGSHAINALVEPILGKLLTKYTILHQTGDAKAFADYDLLTKRRSTFPYTFQERYILRKFVSPDDMRYIFSQASIVVARSGINTVVALLLGDTPALLIPLPYSQGQEQMKNAIFLKESGLGEVLVQDELTSEKLLGAVDLLMRNKEKYTNTKKEEMEKLHGTAAEKIIQVIYGITKDRLQKKIS